MSAKVIAVANQKGGVGKTTTALTLGAALANLNKKILIIDLDPHICASIHLRFYPDEQDTTVYNIFKDEGVPYKDIWPQIIKTQSELKFDVVPGHVHLSELEGDLRSRSDRGFILKTALKDLQNSYDYIILDCPPHVGVLLINALVASDLLIMPIQTDFLALHGLKLIFDTIRTLNKALPEPISYRALPTMYDKRTKACKHVLDLLHTKMGSAIFTSVIPLDTRFREASAQGTVIYSINSASRGAIAYSDLANEVINLW